jgi:hypothetical protein
LHNFRTEIIMRFSLPASLMVLLSLSTAAPAEKRAAGTVSVLKVQTYDEFSISAGVAGSALAEVNAKFPVCFSPLLHIPPPPRTSFLLINTQKVD